MATNFKLKRSAVASKRPGITDLELGELALNTYDGFLYSETTGAGSTVSLLTPWQEKYGQGSIYYTGGFVGIGTRNPDEELHVYGISGDPSIKIENGGTGSSDDTIIKCAIGDTTANNYIYFGDTDDSNVGQIRYDHANDAMTFTTNATERVRIHDDGRMNVGGTSEVQLTGNTQSILFLHGAIVGANLDQCFGTRIIIDDDDTGTTSGGDRERGSILAQFNGNASGGDTADETRIWNIHSDINCTADYDNVYGLYSDVRTTHSSGTCSAIRGVYAITQKQGSGAATEMVGVYGISQNSNSSSGTVNDIVGGKFKANLCAGTGTGTATDLVGVWGNIDNDAENTQPTGGKCALFYGSYDKTTNLHNPQAGPLLILSDSDKFDLI